MNDEIMQWINDKIKTCSDELNAMIKIKTLVDTPKQSNCVHQWVKMWPIDPHNQVYSCLNCDKEKNPEAF